MAREGVVPKVETKTDHSVPTDAEIAALAYSLWEARGYPEGSADEDWFNAERALKTGAEE
jgi:hypothetical protein